MWALIWVGFVGAVVVLADDGGGGTISTTTSTGNGGSGSGGGGDPMLPTTTITSVDNMDGTITWTVRFSSSISNIALSQFSASDGGTLDMLSATSGTEITLRSTHTADGSITLRYTGTSAAMQTSGTVALTLPPPMVTPGVVGLLEDIPTTAQARVVSTVSGTRSILRRAGTGDDSAKFVVELGAPTSRTAYTFQTGTNAGAAMEYQRAVNEDNTFIYRPFPLLDTNDMPIQTVGNLHVFYTGTNFDDATQTTVSAIDILATGTRDSVFSRSGTVSYSGRYIVATNPAAGQAFDSTTQTGTLTMSVNFGTEAVSGETRDANDMKSGEISASTIVNALFDGTFTGEGSLAGYSHSLHTGGTNIVGGFYSSDSTTTTGTADEFVDVSRGSVMINSVATPYVMGMHAVRDSN